MTRVTVRHHFNKQQAGSEPIENYVLVEEHGDYVAVVDSHAADAAARDNASPKCLPACNAVGGHAKGCPEGPPVPDFWDHGSVG